ncbi:MAG TPA: glycosyltransferase family 2 protein, partial [Streptosporangiaceae bacterium]
MFELAGHGDQGRVQHTYQALGTEPAAAGRAVPPGPRATVVIATRNRGPELGRTLERLASLPERPPVVVVDNGSDDGTAAMVRHRFPRAELIALRRNRGAWARNLGVLRARTPLIALADDDSWWAPGALATAAAVL